MINLPVSAEISCLGRFIGLNEALLLDAAGDTIKRRQRIINIGFRCEATHTKANCSFIDCAYTAVGGGSAVQAGAGENAKLLFQMDSDIIAGDAGDVERKHPDRISGIGRAVDLDVRKLFQAVAETLQ